MKLDALTKCPLCVYSHLIDFKLRMSPRTSLLLLCVGSVLVVSALDVYPQTQGKVVKFQKFT